MPNYCACGCGKEIKPQSTWASGHNSNKTKDRFDWSNLIEDYKRLGTLEQVAKVYGCTLQAVYHQLNKRGVDTSLGVIDWSNVVQDYNKLKSTKKVAEKYNCEPSTVANKLKSYGIRLSHDNKPLNVEVGVGRYGERIALFLLDGSKDMNDLDILSPYDIEWNGNKIDVKTSRKRSKRGQYSFSTRKKKCDYFFLIALDEMDIPNRFLFIPGEEIGGSGLAYTFGKKSKWDQYEVKFSEQKISEAIKTVKTGVK
jgi:hypothetical protein